MKKIFSIITLIGIALTACSRMDEPPKVEQPRSSRFEVSTFCYDGVEYFGTWNNNAFSQPALTGAVIDKDTLRPKQCVENTVTLK